ncbi:DUF3667 domain-containing protein [Flavobacteriaceae bacterium R38]|nr:DUF3667 domain-containing protein [Flavobacteriaceae bacterium R38]
MNCKNCEIELAQTNGYCHKCGARIIKNRLTFKNLMTQLGEEFLNYDNKILKTIKHLFTKPEAVIDGYVKGIRKKYVNPVSFFTISLTLSGFIGFLISSYFREAITLPTFGEVNQNEDVIAVQNSTFDFISNYTSLFASLSIPFTALLSFLIFFNKKYNLTEHVILNLYAYSLVSIITFFISFPVLLIAPGYYTLTGFISLPLYLIYYSYVLIEVFNLSFSQFILKSLLFGGIVLFFMILSGFITFLLIKSGVIDPAQLVPPPEVINNN